VRKIRPPLLYIFEVAKSESGVCLTKLAHFQGHLKVNFCFLMVMQFLSADSERAKNFTFGYVVESFLVALKVALKVIWRSTLFFMIMQFFACVFWKSEKFHVWIHDYFLRSFSRSFKDLILLFMLIFVSMARYRGKLFL